MNRNFLLFLVASASLVLSSCLTVPRDFGEPEKKAVIPNYFLHSGYEPLDDWLDEPFKVRFDRVPFSCVFDEVPLVGIHYRVEAHPENPEPLSIDTPAMTRRQLLWAISQHYNLDMHFVYSNRQPSELVVTARPSLKMD